MLLINSLLISCVHTQEFIDTVTIENPELVDHQAAIVKYEESIKKSEAKLADYQDKLQKFHDRRHMHGRGAIATQSRLHANIRETKKTIKECRALVDLHKRLHEEHSKDDEDGNN